MPEVIYYLIRPLSHFIISFGTDFAVKVNQSQSKSKSIKSTLFLKASVLVTGSHFWEIQTLTDLIFYFDHIASDHLHYVVAQIFG